MVLDIDIQLSFTIKGICAASGLFLKNNELFIISDNSNVLYKYDINTNYLNKINTLQCTENGIQENIRKKYKSDAESICHYNNNLYILGSGSKSNRNNLIVYSLTDNELDVIDLTGFYNHLMTVADIDIDDFNIEGTIFTGTEWFLFNRGNSSSIKNGVFKIKNERLIINPDIIFYSISLPKINNVNTSFTDAILLNDKIFFLATAEATDSSYNDGDILGSIIGIIQPNGMQLITTEIISETQKFEGITLLLENNNQIAFLLCEDKDSKKILESNIYKLTITL